MNPFVLQPYLNKELFCDREEETKYIVDAIVNKRNLTLYSIRRLGKTGLIMRVQDALPKKYVTVYIDVLDTEDDQAFANKLISRTILELEKRKKKWLQKAIEIFGRFKAVIVVDPVSGIPTISLDLKEKAEIQMSLSLLFNIIKEEKYQFQFSIDEFQQIANYEKSTIDATLRQYIQTIDNIHFIFSGSQRHLLNSLFIDTKKPLFRTTELMQLKKIAYPAYIDFIQYQFKMAKKYISETQAHHILEWTKQHTYYTQYFCHILFSLTKKKVLDSDIEQLKRKIYRENETTYYQFKKLMTKAQWKLLSAIAKENIATNITSQQFRTNYNIGAASSIQRSLQSLLDKEMIYENVRDKKQEYEVYDVFLSRWLQAL